MIYTNCIKLSINFLNSIDNSILGIESKLDYLVELGVGGIWLSPIYKSPMADFGYDISDYMAIDPIFGTMDDFVSLVESAHSKGHCSFKLMIVSMFPYYLLL